MFGPVLSVLLMGMVPSVGTPAMDTVAQSDLSVAAPLPTTASASLLPALSEHLSASGMLIVDLQSGQTLVEHNVTSRRPIGSLTKLMTALIIVENHTMDEIVTVPKDIGKVQGSVAHLQPGDRYTVGDMLTAMLVASANDAAQTLAQFHSGSVQAFVAEMNERARVLGLKNSLFATPDGMDRASQWSTPQDLAWLTSFVLHNGDISRRMSLPETTITSLGGRQLKLEHTHALLHEQSPVIAGKTGTTEAAGQCLLSIVQERDREYIVVLLGSRERYVDMKIILAALASRNF